MATTITLANGVRIDTTDDLTAALPLLLGTTAPQTAKPSPQPKAAEPKPEPQPKAGQAQPAPTKRTTTPKAAAPKVERQPKAAKSDGKALWAAITTAVAEGRYEEARGMAAAKPLTFGVQAEAAIERHMAKVARPKAAQPSPRPKAAAPKPEPKAEAAKPHPVLDMVLPVEPPKERRAAKRAKAAQEAIIVAKVRASHKPDCGCVTCPKGVAARKAKAEAPKVEAKPAAKPAQPKAAKVAKPAQAPKVAATADAEAERREAQRIMDKAVEDASKMLTHLDTEAITKAMQAYNALANRNERLGNMDLCVAYNDAADTMHVALLEAKSGMLTSTK